MIRTFFRLLSMVALAVAVIMAVLDATRSIAAEALVVTPLGTSWAALSPSTLDGVEQMIVGKLPAFFWEPLALAFLGLPGFVVFAMLALLFSIAGHRRDRGDRFALER